MYLVCPHVCNFEPVLSCLTENLGILSCIHVYLVRKLRILSCIHVYLVMLDNVALVQ